MNAAGLKLLAEVPRSIPSRLLEAIPSPESGVQIWIAHLDSISSIDMIELIAPLDSTEHARGAQFRFERDRQRYVAARGILRCLLGTALDIPATALVFHYGPHGKPAIAAAGSDERTLHFNISHAAGSAIFALAWDRELGIDLEAVAHITDQGEKLSDLATRILSSRELAIWRQLPNDTVRAPALLRAWTRKEAYIKATGEGLFHRLQDIEVALDPVKPKASLAIRSSPDEGKANCGWTLYDLTAPASFVAAVAVAQAGPLVA